MPSTEKSNRWWVRIDGAKTFLRSKCRELQVAPDTVRILGAYHIGDKKENPHIHFAIETLTVIQKQSFVVRLKKLFEIASSNKTLMSCVPWDGQDAVFSYLYHEDDTNPEWEIVVNKGYNEEDLERFKSMNKMVQKVIEVNKQKAPGRCVEKLLRFYESEGYAPTRADIITKLLEWIRDGEMYEPGNFQLEKYMEEVYLKTRPKAEWQDYVDGRVASILRRINF